MAHISCQLAVYITESLHIRATTTRSFHCCHPGSTAKLCVSSIKLTGVHRVGVTMKLYDYESNETHIDTQKQLYLNISILCKLWDRKWFITMAKANTVTHVTAIKCQQRSNVTRSSLLEIITSQSICSKHKKTLQVCCKRTANNTAPSTVTQGYRYKKITVHAFRPT